MFNPLRRDPVSSEGVGHPSDPGSGGNANGTGGEENVRGVKGEGGEVKCIGIGIREM